MSGQPAAVAGAILDLAGQMSTVRHEVRTAQSQQQAREYELIGYPMRDGGRSGGILPEMQRAFAERIDESDASTARKVEEALAALQGKLVRLVITAVTLSTAVIGTIAAVVTAVR